MIPIQVGKLDTFLRRLLNLKADAVAPRVTDAVQPGIAMFPENDPELRAPRGDVLGAAWSTSIAGVVGQAPMMVLFNPNNSGKLLIVEAALLALGTTGDLLVGFLVDGVGALGLADISTTRDTRVRGAGAAPRLVGQIFQGTALALPGTIGTLRLDQTLIQAGDTGQRLTTPVVLSPGFGYLVTKTNTSGVLQGGFSSLHQGFLWREREMETSEVGPF